jgi:uncharacterized protein (TIGR02679 family)
MNRDVNVFREEPGFLKLFSRFKEKYRSLGRVGGTVNVRDFTEAELESVAGFLGIAADVLRNKGNVSLLSFEKAREQTPFKNYAFVELLEVVLEETIITKTEEQHLEQEKERRFIESLFLRFSEGGWWWERLQAKSPDTRWIWSLYKQDPEDLFEKLTVVFQAFLQLPIENGPERLPLFAQGMTGNPHYFDSDQTAGKLLTHCLSVHGKREDGMPRSSEQLNDLLGQYGLMRDDLWSFVTCRGFLAEDINGIHPVWKAAAEVDSVLNMPVKELVKLTKLWPVHGNSVWIVENSSVCSTIVDEVPKVPVICTHGQFRTASWVMLDLLADAGCHFHYSGDIDPEGMMMAQRLKDRYNELVTFWRMDPTSYESIISDEDVSSRLSKMDAVTSPELEELVQVVRRTKKAGYQEGLVAALIQDITQ